MPGGSPFTSTQEQQLEAAVTEVAEQTGVRVGLAIGPATSSNLHAEAERMLARLLDGESFPAALVLVDPDRREVEIVTSGPARRIIPDNRARAAANVIAARAGVGELVSGITEGVRSLSAL